MPRIRPRPASRRGLGYRIVLTGGTMALLMIGTFVLLFRAVGGLRDAGAIARRSEGILVSSERLEKLVVDLDEDSRGLVVTGDAAFRREYDADSALLRGQEIDLERTAAAGGADQAKWAHQIVAAEGAYRSEYIVPLMTRARSDALSAKSMLRTGQGLRRLAALRDQSAGFQNAQRGAAIAAEQRSADAARTAVMAATVSAAAALLLVGLFVTYLTRVIIRPVRQAAHVAGEVAEGDLSVRMSEASPGELGTLGHRFNAMVTSLETSRNRLREVADMQGALRRVATLIACGVSPAEVFDAVAAEAGHVLEVEHTEIIRFESDETARVVGYWNDPRVPTVMPPLGGHWPVEGGTVTAAVLTSERPARMKNYERATSAIGVWAHKAGIKCVVGCPVKVEGRVWGAMLLHSLDDEPLPGITEARMQEFVDLIGAAIANAQTRSDLLASRARVVAAADESRRRIERDLHDGAQQRLVTLALKLRTLETTAVAPGQRRLREYLSSLVLDLSDVLDDLQEVSRGIIPPILTRSGLRPALRSLARRSAVPVVLDADVQGRLPERIEVAVYYTVSEALTNVVKHANATEARVGLRVEHRTVRLSIHDDGRGGANVDGGSGLVGLKDRVEALGGEIEVVSPPGEGTSILVQIPVQIPLGETRIP
jgi:signal transduction histidine kinase